MFREQYSNNGRLLGGCCLQENLINLKSLFENKAITSLKNLFLNQCHFKNRICLVYELCNSFAQLFIFSQEVILKNNSLFDRFWKF